MGKYLLLLFLMVYGCHHSAQPHTNFSGESGNAIIGGVSPEIPRAIEIESEGKSIRFVVSMVNASNMPPPESQEHVYLQLESDVRITVDEVMEIAGDIIDSFITRRYFSQLQLNIQTSESAIVKILCIATGDALTTQKTDVTHMTPYYVDITIEAE